MCTNIMILKAISAFCRATGVLLLKMFTNVSFRGLGGISESSWEELQAVIALRKKQLEEGKKGRLDEKTHRVRLALELVDACLQRDPVDRLVVATNE